MLKNDQLTWRLTSLAVALSCASPLLAQDETIQITASRIELAVADTLSDVLVIDRAMIDASAALSLYDLLQGTAGLDLIRKGGKGQEASLFIRGANSNQLLILIDGIEVGSATLGLKALSDLSLGQVERIELVKGPRAALWGSKAIGGVLQIFSRDINRTSLSLGAGSEGLKSVRLETALNKSNYSVQVQIDSWEVDGIDTRLDSDPDRDGAERDNALLKGRYDISDNQQLGFIVQSNEGITEFDTFFGGDELHIDNQLAVINYAWQTETTQQRIQIGKQTDKSTTQGGDNLPLTFQTESETGRYEVAHQINPNWNTGASLEWLNEDIAGSDSTYNETGRTTQSGHLYSHYKSGAFINELALRYTDVERLVSNTSMHLGFGWRPAEQWLMSFNWGEGFKAPTFNDLYFPFGGNPDLKHETSTTSEIRLQRWFETSRVELSVFDTEVDNLIIWQPDADGFFSPRNIGVSALQGVELDVQWQALGLNHQAQVSYIDTEDRQTGQALRLRAKERLSYQITGEIESINGLSYQAQINYTGERPDLDYQTFTPTKLESGTEVNLMLNYQINDDLLIRLRLNDLLDEQLQTASGYRAEGRTVQLQVKLDL